MTLCSAEAAAAQSAMQWIRAAVSCACLSPDTPLQCCLTCREPQSTSEAFQVPRIPSSVEALRGALCMKLLGKFWQLQQQD